MRSSFVAAGLALMLAVPALAQAPAKDPSTPPADAPMEQFTPPNTPAPSSGWTDADKSEDAVKKAKEFLAAAQKAYAGAGEYSQKILLDMATPQGSMSQSMDLDFGKGTDMRMSAQGIQIMSIGDMVLVVPEMPADKYIEQKRSGTTTESISKVLEGFALPTPALIYREAKADTDLVAPLGVGTLQDPQVIGARTTADGVKQVLVGAKNGEAVYSIDPKTGMFNAFTVQFTPEGLPPAIRMAFDAKLQDTPGPLAKPIAFDPGKRTKVGSVAELIDMPAGDDASPPEPEMKVKVGDAAPVSALPMLDGTTVDLASMKGKVVVLDFWATWCPPCRKGLPLLQEYATKVKDNPKVVVYAVNSWEVPGGGSPSDEAIAGAKKKATEYWEKQKFTMGCLFDGKSELIARYGFTGIPATVVIAPDGKIAAIHGGYSPDMVKLLEADVAKALGGDGKSADAAKPAGK